MDLNPKQTYHHKKGILYDESGTEILKFTDITTDANNLTGDLVENMNNYIRCYPDRVEIIEQKKMSNLIYFKTCHISKRLLECANHYCLNQII